MDKKKEPMKPPDPTPDQALVLFGGVMKMLPKELEDLGLGGKVAAEEIPGVAPTWKPTGQGDYMLGRCVDRREKKFDIGTPRERLATVLVFDTAIPGGFRSIWLGADLEIKLHDPLGNVYAIYYDGETRPNRTSQQLNAMKTYRVFKVVPTNIPIPEGTPTE